MQVFNSIFDFNLNEIDEGAYALHKSIWQQKFVELLTQEV